MGYPQVAEQYAAPTYAQQAAQYAPPANQYAAPAQQYGAPASQYGAPEENYGAPAEQYGAPVEQYGAPAGEYAAPSPYDQAPAYRQPASNNVSKSSSFLDTIKNSGLFGDSPLLNLAVILGGLVLLDTLISLTVGVAFGVPSITSIFQNGELREDLNPVSNIGQVIHFIAEAQ